MRQDEQPPRAPGREAIYRSHLMKAGLDHLEQQLEHTVIRKDISWTNNRNRQEVMADVFVYWQDWSSYGI